MDIQVIVTRNFTSSSYTSIDITDLTEQVQWGGSKYGAPRSLEVNLSNVGSTKFSPTDEDYLFLKVDGKELFRGKVFSYSFSTNKKITIKAYDSLYYLTKNKDNRIYLNKTATDIVKSLCNDFDIGMGSIADTGYVIDKQVYQNATVYDMMMKALDVTRKATGNRYYIFSNYGKVSVVRRTELSRYWVIDENTNLMDYSNSVSMENISTRVKLETEFEKDSSQKDGNGDTIKTLITSIADDSDLMKKFGVLQHYEKLSEELNQAQLDDRARQMLTDNSKVERSFDITALGITDVIAGGMVLVVLSELGIKKNYYIDQDNHTFSNGNHTMSLTLTETDDLPDIVIEDYVEEAKTVKATEDTKTKSDAATAAKKDAEQDPWVKAGIEWRKRYSEDTSN